MRATSLLVVGLGFELRSQFELSIKSMLNSMVVCHHLIKQCTEQGERKEKAEGAGAHGFELKHSWLSTLGNLDLGTRYLQILSVGILRALAHLCSRGL